jgi:hypothetical protein
MKHLLASVAFLSPIASPAFAQDWFNIDARSRGMGNAGVAIAEGALGAYWNPAVLAAEQGDVFSFSAGGVAFAGNAFLDVSIEGDILARVDELYDLFSGTDFATIQANLNAGTASEADLQTALTLLAELTDLNQPGLGVVVQSGGSIEMRYGPLGFFVRYLGHMALDVRFGLGPGFASSLSEGSISNGLDDALASIPAGSPVGANATTLSGELQTAGLSAAQADTLAANAEAALGDGGLNSVVRAAIVASAVASLGTFNDPTATLQFNESGVRVSGIVLKEAGVAFAYPIALGLRIGVALKEVIGETFEIDIPLRDLDESQTMLEDIFDQIDQNRRRTGKFDYDVGISFSPLPLVSLGLTAKNVRGNKFEYASGAFFQTRRQLRAGAALHLGIVTVGADFDIKTNKSDSLDGYESRVAGVGVDFKPGIPGIGLSVRGGVFKNLDSADQELVYTVALGAKLGPILIDLNGQSSLKKVDVESASALNGTDSLSLPQRLAFAATVGVDLSW